MPLDMYIQEAKLGLNNRFYISKGARGATSISEKNVRVLASGVAFVGWEDPSKKKVTKSRVIHITIANTDFTCPHCTKKYSDADNKYLDRIQKKVNTSQCYTTIKCTCKNKFAVSFNYKGNMIGFRLS